MTATKTSFEINVIAAAEANYEAFRQHVRAQAAFTSHQGVPDPDKRAELMVAHHDSVAAVARAEANLYAAVQLLKMSREETG